MKVTFTYLQCGKQQSRTLIVFRADPGLIPAPALYEKYFTPAIAFICDPGKPVFVCAELADHYLRGQFYPEDLAGAKSSSFCYTHKLPSSCDCVYELSGEVSYDGVLVKNLCVTLYHSIGNESRACQERCAAATLLRLLHAPSPSCPGLSTSAMRTDSLSETTSTLCPLPSRPQTCVFWPTKMVVATPVRPKNNHGSLQSLIACTQ